MGGVAGTPRLSACPIGSVGSRRMTIGAKTMTNIASRPEGKAAKAAGLAALRDLVANPGFASDKGGWLQPRHFARPRHGIVYEAIADLRRASLGRAGRLAVPLLSLRAVRKAVAASRRPDQDFRSRSTRPSADPRSDVRQALDAHPLSDLREALAASGGGTEPVPDGPLCESRRRPLRSARPGLGNAPGADARRWPRAWLRGFSDPWPPAPKWHPLRGT